MISTDSTSGDAAPPAALSPPAPHQAQDSAVTHCGEVVQLNSLKCFVARPSTKTCSALVVAHDAFGVDSGRTRQICNDLAENLGVLVISPDFWHFLDEDGDGSGAAALVEKAIAKSSTGWEKVAGIVSAPKFLYGISQRGWEVVAADYEESIAPFLKQEGITRLAALGFSWGGWFVMHASAKIGIHKGEQQAGDEPPRVLGLCCGVSVHPDPSVFRVQWENIREVCASVQCPQMVLSAVNDPKAVKPGGAMDKILMDTSFGTECVFETVPELFHGCANRGDIADPKVAKASARALELSMDFLRKHLLQQS